MSADPTVINGLDALPNEIMISMLSNFFSTLELLPITLTSRRFHSLILHIIHSRLLAVSSLPGQSLILECFHPSTKLQTPYLLCDFLGTYRLLSPDSSSKDGEEELSLGKLHLLYSHFRPIKPESDYRTPRPHPAGGWLAMSPGSNALVNEDYTSLVCQNVHLESYELFSQLCTIISLVKIGPKRGIFLSCVTVGEGFMRVWRDWLKERSHGRDLEGLLWADLEKNVGLKVNAIDRTDMPAAALVGRYEDEAVSYSLQYEELVVRTSQLLLRVEQSFKQKFNSSGRAIVIGSWE